MQARGERGESGAGRKGFLKEVKLGSGLQGGWDPPNHEPTKHRNEWGSARGNKEARDSWERGEIEWQRLWTGANKYNELGFQVGKFRDSSRSWESPLVLELRATQPGVGIARHKLGRVRGTPLWSFQWLGWPGSLRLCA